ncbi:MAG: hypothetical protein DMG68_07185 [Acidobacteria bacterium]|nr:MAG: hypothetical protein DMG68_07185 [Acidobacteriota bacterium]
MLVNSKVSCSFALLVALAFLPSPAQAAGNRKAANHPLCSSIAQSKLQASAGAQMFCFGSQPNNAPIHRLNMKNAAPAAGTAKFRTNVDAASLSEDISPAGVRAYGQSEVSIAAAGQYVVEAWNDSTGFFTVCGAPMNKEELTGFGFSNNNGASFTDMGGTPVDCTQFINEGDPAVEAYQVNGHTYFYITQITIPLTIPENGIGLNACQVMGTGSTATLHCNNTILAAISSDCFSGFFCSFLDKEFITIDKARKRLYISYTEFGVNTVSFAGQVEVAECDISNPMAPVCSNGSAGTQAPPYLAVVSDPNCENEGAYPALDKATGDLYIANEFNWATNIFSGACFNTPTQEVVHRIPFSCLPSSGVSSCSPPFTSGSVNIVSMDAAFIPGYNRFPMNDFPRIAVSSPKGTVSVVWNDAGANPNGVILLQSFPLKTLAEIQSSPVTLNNDAGSFNWHFLPALRYASGTGLLNVSWYERQSPQTPNTDVFSIQGFNPTSSTTPATNDQVNDMTSNWLLNNSDIIPNFGDYTDNFLGTSGYWVAWSDGRINDPQPYSAKHR